MNARIPRIGRVLLIISLLATCFLEYWGYSRDFYAIPGIWLDVVHGTSGAPQQYRVGVVDTAFWMTQHLHMGMRHAFALMDLFSMIVSSLLLLRLLEQSSLFQRASRSMVWFSGAAFILLINFYLLWVMWYQRPETLPTTLTIAVSLWLWTRKPGDTASTSKYLLTALALLLIATIQGLIRADVSCMLNAGFFIAALTGVGRRLSLPRGMALITTALSAVVAAGIQLYMMKVVYPHATYGDTLVVVLWLNLFHVKRHVPFLLFIGPVVWTYVQAIRRRFTEDAAGVGMLAGAAAFSIVWFVMGGINELRIFMPFAIALIPMTVQLALLRAADDGAI